MKPDIVFTIENQLGQTLQPLTTLADPLDGVRHEYNLSYLLDGDRLIGLNVCNTELLTELKLDAEECATLVFLNCSGNKNLRQLWFTGPLPSLKYLDLSGCGLEQLTLPAGCLQLNKAWLQNNQLNQLAFAGPCPRLELLDLSNNRLKDVVLPFGFTSLAHLYMVNNGLVNLRFDHDPGDGPECRWHSPLPELQTLHLAENNLQQVPENIIFSKKLTALYLGGNVSKNIPKIFLGEYERYTARSCLAEARTWFTEIREHPHEKNRTVKLMLLGNGNVGKSTLACAMTHGRCQHDAGHHQSTHGILLQTLEKDNIVYHIWDFGGQEVYHGTHRLFISFEALQVIVFDAETEEMARNYKSTFDRVRQQELVRPHPIPYWFETTCGLSAGSRFCLVQNIKRPGDSECGLAREYAGKNGIEFQQLNASTGENLAEIWKRLPRLASALPDYGMTMPTSWLKVRQFFIDNLEKEDNRKILYKDEFYRLCDDCEVMEASRELLLRYLHHYGYVYCHDNLGDRIIADQKWALQAIYKPYDRYAGHYQEFFDLEGKIRVSKLFEVFGDGYTEKEKWLFLEFMRSCGLCFQLNDQPWRETKGLEDVYVFPEFLPDIKPVEAERFWEERARDPHILRYRLPWLNYYLVQSFIVALGRKTETKNFWRYGIHVPTHDGWFKVELDYGQKALIVHIEQEAMAQWLVPILEALHLGSEKKGWEISFGGGVFSEFDLENWQKTERSPAGHHPIDPEIKQGGKPLEQLADKKQELGREVVLFLASNPTNEKINLRGEHSQIAEKLADRQIRKKFELVPRFDVTLDRMIEAIMEEQPAIIHFIGHGMEGHPMTGRGNGIVINTEDYQGGTVVCANSFEHSFRRIKKIVPGLKLVLLNLCYSEPQAIAISKNGIHAVGVNDEVKSSAARMFAAGFYRNYGLHGDIEAAVNHGLTVGVLEDDNIENLVHLFFNGKLVPVG